MPEDEATQVGDTLVTPVTDETTDDDGNTVVIGYPPTTVTVYEGGVSDPSAATDVGAGQTNPDGSEGA